MLRRLDLVQRVICGCMRMLWQGTRKSSATFSKSGDWKGSHSTVSQGNAVDTVSQQPNLDIGIRKGTSVSLSRKIKERVAYCVANNCVKHTIKEDELIMMLGEEWLHKSSRNQNRRIGYASERMRRAGRILMKARELESCPEMTMDRLLYPDKVDTIVTATIMECGAETGRKLGQVVWFARI